MTTPTKRRRGREAQRMTAGEFNRLAPLIHHVNPQRIEAARKHLVLGLTQQEIADEYGWTRQNVSGAVKIVRSAAEKLKELNRLSQKTD